jgi:hypothetical protein
MIPPTYKPKEKFMQLAIAEAKRASDRGDYAIGAVSTQLIGNREVVIEEPGATLLLAISREFSKSADWLLMGK